MHRREPSAVEYRGSNEFPEFMVESRASSAPRDPGLVVGAERVNWARANRNCCVPTRGKIPNHRPNSAGVLQGFCSVAVIYATLSGLPVSQHC